MMQKRVLRRVLIAAGLLFAAFILYSAFRGFTDVEIGENVAHVSWLPDSASNVSFYRAYSYTACEFDIAEADFLKWAERFSVKRIGNAPVRVTRYHFPSGKIRPASAPSSTAPADVEVFARTEESYSAAMYATIHNGWFYEEEYHNGGGTTVAYDTDRHRAYYKFSPR